MMDPDELSGMLQQVTIKKTWTCDPEYIVIRWYRKIKELLCGKKSS